MVVTRPLGSLIERAAGDGVVAFKDNIDRFCDDWGELLELGPLARRPYVSSGLVVLAGESGQRVLHLWHERRDRPEYQRSWFERREADYPFLFLDQDILNAVVGSRAVGPAELVVVDGDLAPNQPYRGVRVTSEAKVRCAYDDGREPYVVHQYLEKPWVKPMYHGVYSRLLARLWLGDDVAVPMPREEVPLRMRPGAGAWLVRKAVDLADLLRWYARDVIPEWLARRRGRPRKVAGAER
jgi:hypothetical protein